MAAVKRLAGPTTEHVTKKQKFDNRNAKAAERTNGGNKGKEKGDWNKNNNKYAQKQTQNGGKLNESATRPGNGAEGESFLNGKSSREAHQAQRELAAQRKLAKPAGDIIFRSKKIWEKLRIKSAVPKDERTTLVDELFSIITGHVKDFVFKHDSVRVIQCALKYANKEQKLQIMEELSGSYRELAESRYAKFLVAKLVVQGDKARDVIVGEFQGAVKRMIRHPEAGWILDDVYRGAATEEQKGKLLREWYGPEFVVFGAGTGEVQTADLGEILQKNPEKRAPIMSHLEMINLLVQKKTTGFTMLHDAMLQYFLNVKVGSPEHTEFLEMLKDDEEGDCVRNLAFTKSGSRILCLALAYGNAKDRRNILRLFKTHIRPMAADPNACHVLLTAYEVIDDTVMTAKAVFPELLGKEMEQEAREQELITMVNHVTPRIALLYLMAPEMQKWLVTEEETKIIDEVRDLRKDTSKKDPEKRRQELVEAMSQPLLDLIASQARMLASSSFGCQFMAEALIGGSGEKEDASKAVLNLVEVSELADSPAFGRMLKTLVQGGRFDPATKKIVAVSPSLGFHNKFYEHITRQEQDAILPWASGGNSFVVLGMLEAEDFAHKDRLTTFLHEHVEELEVDNAGARKILENLGLTVTSRDVQPKEKTKPKRP